MIWGKTNKQKIEKQKQKDSNWFAWRPVQLDDGRWCWFERVRRVFWASWGTAGYDYYLL